MNKKPLSFYMITTGLLTVFLLLLQAAANFSKPVFYVLVGVLLIFVIGAAFRLKSEFMDYFKSMKLAAALLIYLTIGVVEFENGLRAMGQIDVDESYDLKLGAALLPTWAPVREQYGEDVYGLVLAPMG